MKLKTEPYSSFLKELSSKDKTCHINDNKFYFSGILIYYIAKASGLKSNKTRKIKKRFKRVLMDSLLSSFNTDDNTI